VNVITISSFSGGVSSAVATKLCIKNIDRIIYINIDDQHIDTLRFVKECEKWFEKPIEIMQSPYKTVENVCRTFRYLVGKNGSRCTDILKRRVRKEWESNNHFFNQFRYIWGMDYSKHEIERVEKLKSAMPQHDHIFPLIDQKLTKEDAHKILNASKIKRPAMYDLGYQNNNCVGCLKGGMGYWNKIRVDFPEVFSARAVLEREIGASCIHTKKDGRIYLDELSPDRGRMDEEIMDECGMFCEAMAI